MKTQWKPFQLVFLFYPSCFQTILYVHEMSHLQQTHIKYPAENVNRSFVLTSIRVCWIGIQHLITLMLFNILYILHIYVRMYVQCICTLYIYQISTVGHNAGYFIYILIFHYSWNNRFFCFLFFSYHIYYPGELCAATMVLNFLWISVILTNLMPSLSF